jgi:hypothetical protein
VEIVHVVETVVGLIVEEIEGRPETILLHGLGVGGSEGIAIDAVSGEIGQEVNYVDLVPLLHPMQRAEERQEVFSPPTDSPVLRQFHHVGIGIELHVGQDGPLAQNGLEETLPLGVVGQTPQGRS